jgi:hypothetical protein
MKGQAAGKDAQGAVTVGSHPRRNGEKALPDPGLGVSRCLGQAATAVLQLL